MMLNGSDTRFGLRRSDGAFYLGRDLEGHWWGRDGYEEYAAYWQTREGAEAGLRALRDYEIKEGTMPRVVAKVVEL